MIKHAASGFTDTSPVMRPTSPNFLRRSRNFWLLSALMGDVYTHRVMWLAANAMAYSATTVLPADVCAATNTKSLCSK